MFYQCWKSLEILFWIRLTIDKNHISASEMQNNMLLSNFKFSIAILDFPLMFIVKLSHLIYFPSLLVLFIDISLYSYCSLQYCFLVLRGNNSKFSINFCSSNNSKIYNNTKISHEQMYKIDTKIKRNKLRATTLSVKKLKER